TRIPTRRCQFVMPRSSNSVRANDEPSKCKFNVERINHQPAAWIQLRPPNRLINKVKSNVVNRIAVCERNSLKWIKPRRVIGAGKRKATSVSVKASEVRSCGKIHAARMITKRKNAASDSYNGRSATECVLKPAGPA